MRNGVVLADPWGLAWRERTYVMGIVNVTPDSFSGDGLFHDPNRALVRAEQEVLDGADVIDVGGQSTRPGAPPVTTEEELGRVLPAIEVMCALERVPIAIDTMKAEVAKAALGAGACIVNDVSGLRADPDMASVVRESGAGLVIMHSRRRRVYRDVVTDVLHFLYSAVDRAVASGIALDTIVVDPGFGFAKAPRENLALLRRLGELVRLGRPILVGTSRKATIGAVLKLAVEDRVEGTAATVALAISNGADIVRVHDVRAMVRVARMADSVVRGWSGDTSPFVEPGARRGQDGPGTHRTWQSSTTRPSGEA